jgi:hypothetical protein
MAIANWEKVAVLEATEVWYSYPVILVLLVWVGWCHTCFCGKRELSDSICQHLFWVRSWKSVLHWFYCFLYRCHRMCSATDGAWIERMNAIILASEDIRVWLSERLLDVNIGSYRTFSWFHLTVNDGALDRLYVDLLLLRPPLYQVLYLCRLCMLSLLCHESISIGLWALVWLPWSSIGPLLLICSLRNVKSSKCLFSGCIITLVLLVTQWTLVAWLDQIRFLVLLDLPRVIGWPALLLAVVSVNYLLHIVPASQFIVLRIINKLGIMSFLKWMIHLAWDYRH